MTDTTSPAMQNAIIRLEVQVESLAKEVHSLRNDVQKSQAPGLVTMQTELKHFKEKLDEISADVKLSKKTPWSLYFGFAMLLWSVGGGIGYGFYNLQNTKIEAKLDQAVFEEWKLAAERRATERDKAIQELRNTRR